MSIHFTHIPSPSSFFTQFLPQIFMSQELNGFAEPTVDEIAFCAYLIWEKEGRPEGREREHWHQAHTQLLATRAHEKWTGEPEKASSVVGV